MYFEDVGHGDAVLLLHGNPSPVTDLAEVAAHLAPHVRVLTPHLPGYGRTPPVEDLGYDSVARTLVEALRARGAARLRAIVGYSSGSYRAMHLALRRDLVVERVVGLASFAHVDADLAARLVGAAAALRADPTAAAIRAMVPELWLSARWRAAHPEDADRVRSWIDLTTPAQLIAELEGQARLPDLRPELPRLGGRIALRVGAEDRACPPAWSEEIARLSAAELAIVPATGHALLLEDRDATIAWIVDQVSAAR